MDKLLRKKKIAEDSLDENLQGLHPYSFEFIVPYPGREIRMILLPVNRLEEDAYSIAVIQDVPLEWSKISAPLEIWSRPTIPHFNKRKPSRSERNTRRHRGAGNSFPIFS